MRNAARTLALALTLAATPLAVAPACEPVGVEVLPGSDGQDRLFLSRRGGFRDAERLTGVPWQRLFVAFRTAHEVVAIPCRSFPDRRHRLLSIPLPPGDGPVPEPRDCPGPRPPGIPAASFFCRMPMDAWRTPFDGVWGCSRSDGRRRHKGIDMHAEEGTPIYTVAAGTVYRAWNVKTLELDGGYGNYVILEHDARESSGYPYWTYYTHMRDNPTVREGERVPAGLRIGSVGRTPVGRFTNAHLHFEVRIGNGSELGVAVNPTPFGSFRARFSDDEGAF